MRLKRLEVLGFKSFADRLDMEFVPGVSAFVGPNGSGKSNIADAIRWVLGEQSARTLRGSKMEDIIFAGSATRKSVNFAQVTLSLDNSDGYLPVDFAEVAITRRVYRSGESEYLLNLRPCRLKEIAELFMDSGLGKEAYSIIGQGRIEEILSTKGEDRRGIFEEAAGIVKYKARKREAQKKMADADSNMVRVQDLLAELASQLTPMQVAAQEEKEYRLLQSQLATTQVSLLVAEIEQLLAKRVQGQALLQQFTLRHDMLTMDVAGADQQVNALRMQADQFDQDMQLAQARLLDTTQKVEQSEANRRVAFERQEHAIATLDELRLAADRLSAEGESADREQAEAHRQLQLVQEELMHHEEALRQEEQKIAESVTVQALRNQLSTARTNLFEAMRTQASERNEVTNATNLVEQLENQKERLLAQTISLDTDILRLQEQQQTCSIVLQDETAKAKDYLQKIDAKNKLIQQLDDEIKKRSVAEHELERTLFAIQSRLKTLQELQHDRDGFAGGPKAILLALDDHKLTGVHGAVADLFKVEQEHERAIETALSGAMQHIIMATEADARKAIDYLKKRQLGRATFLPLETIKGRKIPLHDLQMVRSASGFIGVASELVKADTVYRQVVDWLLGNTIVATGLAQANTIARVLQHRVRVVTLEGDVVNPGGSMSGGSVAKNGVGLLSRSREIDDLVRRETELEENLRGRIQERESLIQQVQQDKREIALWQEGIVTCDRAVREYQANQMRLDVQLQALQDQDTAREAEYERIGKDWEEAKNKVVFFQNRLTQAHEAVLQTEQQIAQLEQTLSALEDAQSDQKDRITALKVEVGQRQEMIRGMQLAMDQLKKRKIHLEEESDRVATETAKTQERLSQLRQELLAFDQEGKGAEEIRDGVQRDLSAMRTFREVRIRALEEGESKRNDLLATLHQLQEEMHSHDLNVSRMEAELEGKLELLRDEYGLGLELAKEKYPVIEQPYDLRPKVQSLRRALEAFSDVRLGAIEELERLEERYTFLQSQEQDLLQAQAQLEQLIEKIDEEMAHRFMNVFSQVREQFRYVFSSLFDGGKADVFLLDEQDPLGSGIEIVAEPPGKKMQSLSLLSGGERALTALALLFAILRVRPVPFCVLDEVEAALDEANVARFASYLREFSTQTQFIVITHRRGTMEAADVLYGVTMQESGVSKLVSVRVTDEEEDSIESA